MAKSKQIDCDCGSGSSYVCCCGRFIVDDKTPGTAEALMRSRYTAYAKSDFDYLLASWHTSTRPDNLYEKQPLQWIGLKVLKTEAGQAVDRDGTVEFIARYKVNGKAYRLHEISRFVKEDKLWRYIDGEIQPV